MSSPRKRAEPTLAENQAIKLRSAAKAADNLMDYLRMNHEVGILSDADFKTLEDVLGRMRERAVGVGYLGRRS